MALEDLQRSIQSRLYGSYIGQEVSVLVEGESAKSSVDLTGHSTCHKVLNFAGDQRFLGRVVRVRVTAAKSHSLYGEMVGLPQD